jgi:tetratricopeptide (TPR) repeat protein
MPLWRSWEVACICALLVIMVFVVFGQTVGHGFVNYDDDTNVYESPEITAGVSLHGIAWAFTHTQVGRWAPVTAISRQIDCQFYGLWAGGHHRTNVLLHAAATVLLFLALLKLTGAIWRSGFVTAVFAVHPLHVECAAWISARGELLCGVFTMLALWSYTIYARKPERPFHYAMSICWFSLALMSKPTIVTLPFVLLLLDYWPLGRFRSRSAFPGLLKEKLPLFTLSALSCVGAVLAQKRDIHPAEIIPFSLRVGNAVVAYVVYLGKLIWPSQLAVLYPPLNNGSPAWQVMDACLVLAALTAGAYALRRKQPYLLVGWLWYLGMLAPMIGLVQVGREAYADRYTYLPQIGLCMAGTWAAADWAGRRLYRRATLGGAASVILCALLVAAWHQTGYWRDSVTLWTHTIACTGDNADAHNNLGLALVEQVRTGEAVSEFRETLRIDPSYIDAHRSLGVIFLGKREPDQAIAEFQKAVAIDPNAAPDHDNLGVALFLKGQVGEAIAEIQQSLQIDPGYVDAHRNLGIIFLGKGKVDEAIGQFQEALRLNPGDAKARQKLDQALAMKRSARN